MIKYDLHVHTEYCGHAVGMTIPKIIERIDKLGLETIAITDHIFGPESEKNYEIIKQEVAKFNPKCKVIVGAEVDVDGNHTDGRLVIDKLDHIDYVIAGFHYIPGIGNYAHHPGQCDLNEFDLLRVWQSTLMGIVGNPGVDTLAHPGRMISTGLEIDRHFDRVLSTLTEIARISAKNNIAWELNDLSGYRVPEVIKPQWHRIYETALEQGVKIVFGSDAHAIEDIAGQEFAKYILDKLPAGALSGPEIFQRPK